jgi:hypothetical protein
MCKVQNIELRNLCDIVNPKHVTFCINKFVSCYQAEVHYDKNSEGDYDDNTQSKGKAIPVQA